MQFNLKIKIKLDLEITKIKHSSIRASKPLLVGEVV